MAMKYVVSSQPIKTFQSLINLSQGITFMAVDPDHQRKGVGSTLLKMLCDIVDKNELHTFVLSSPDGVQLYSKFGFKPVGVVETKQGNFTSMLRNPDLDARKNMEFSLSNTDSWVFFKSCHSSEG